MAGSSVEFWNLPLELGSLTFGGGWWAVALRAARSLGKFLWRGNFKILAGEARTPLIRRSVSLVTKCGVNIRRYFIMGS
jgi:hypothetical protein